MPRGSESVTVTLDALADLLETRVSTGLMSVERKTDNNTDIFKKNIARLVVTPPSHGHVDLDALLAGTVIKFSIFADVGACYGSFLGNRNRVPFHLYTRYVSDLVREWTERGSCLKEIQTLYATPRTISLFLGGRGVASLSALSTFVGTPVGDTWDVELMAGAALDDDGASSCLTSVVWLTLSHFCISSMEDVAAALHALHEARVPIDRLELGVNKYAHLDYPGAGARAGRSSFSHSDATSLCSLLAMVDTGLLHRVQVTLHDPPFPGAGALSHLLPPSRARMSVATKALCGLATASALPHMSMTVNVGEDKRFVVTE